MDVNRAGNKNIAMISSSQEISDELLAQIEHVSRNISATIVDELEEFYAQNPEYLDLITEGYFRDYQEI